MEQLVPWIVAGAALVLTADRMMAAFDHLGVLPKRFRTWDHRRAREIVEHERRENAITALAERSELILTELVPNGGRNLRDALTRIEAKLYAHIEENAPLIEEHHAVKRSLDAHLSLHLDGPAP